MKKKLADFLLDGVIFSIGLIVLAFMSVSRTIIRLCGDEANVRLLH